VKKRTAFILLFLFVASFAYAREESAQWKITHLEDQKQKLSAEYEKLRQQQSEITIKLHEIETQLGELKLKLKEDHTRAVSNLSAYRN
jgi:predicted  nucleic acid-binding Zn-ribbon protein